MKITRIKTVLLASLATSGAPADEMGINDSTSARYIALIHKL